MTIFFYFSLFYHHVMQKIWTINDRYEWIPMISLVPFALIIHATNTLNLSVKQWSRDISLQDSALKEKLESFWPKKLSHWRN